MNTLGSGSFGTTVLVEDRAKKTWCVKLVSLKHLVDCGLAADLAKARKAVQKETDALVKLTHVNILRLFDCFVEDVAGQETVGMRTNFLPGGSLEDRIADGDYTDEQALQWVLDIAEALKFAHSMRPKVLHCDLKPANVCIDEDGRAVVIDWGASWIVFSSLRRSTTATRGSDRGVVGTPWYNSPERFKDGHFFIEDDIWAWGLIALQTVLRKECNELFRGPVVAERVEEVDDFIADAQAHPTLGRVGHAIRLALSVEKERRPTAPQLVQLLLGEDVAAATSPSPTTPSSSPALDDADGSAGGGGRRPRVVPATAVSLVAAPHPVSPMPAPVAAAAPSDAERLAALGQLAAARASQDVSGAVLLLGSPIEDARLGARDMLVDLAMEGAGRRRAIQETIESARMLGREEAQQVLRRILAQNDLEIRAEVLRVEERRRAGQVRDLIAMANDDTLPSRVRVAASNAVLELWDSKSAEALLVVAIPPSRTTREYSELVRSLEAMKVKDAERRRIEEDTARAAEAARQRAEDERRRAEDERRRVEEEERRRVEDERRRREEAERIRAAREAERALLRLREEEEARRRAEAELVSARARAARIDDVAAALGRVEISGVRVFITPTGTKYHLAGCRFAKGEPVSVAAARSRGLAPCQLCGAP